MPTSTGLTPSQPADPTKASFLTLPAEIRNNVYDILLGFAEPVEVRWDHVRRSEPPRNQFRTNEILKLSVGLILSCRGIHDEVVSTFYTNNIFKLTLGRGIWSHLAILQAPAALFRSIGSQANILTHVSVDLSLQAKRWLIFRR